MYDFKCQGISVYHPVEDQLDLIAESFIEVYGAQYSEHIEDNLTSMICLSYAGGGEYEYFHQQKEKLYLKRKELENLFTRMFGVKVLDLKKFIEKEDKQLNVRNSAYFMNLPQKIVENNLLSQDEQEWFVNPPISVKEKMEWIKDENNAKHLVYTLIKLNNHNLVKEYDIINEQINRCDSCEELYNFNNKEENLKDNKNESFLIKRLEEISKIELTNKEFLVEIFKEIQNWSSKDLERELQTNSVFTTTTFPYFCKSLGYNYKNVQECLKDQTFMQLVFNKEFLLKWNYVKNDGDFRVEKVVDILQKEKIYSYDINKSVSYIKWPFAGGSLAHVNTTLNVNGQRKIICNIPNLLVKDTWLSVHELGHVIDEFDLKQECGANMRRNGFEISKSVHDGDGVKDVAYKISVGDEIELVSCATKRPYERFNEIINDYITKKVSQVLELKGGKLGLKQFEDEREHSFYTLGFDVFASFIDKYFYKFISCKMEKHNFIDKVENEFGWNNINKLAELADNYINEKDKLLKSGAEINSNEICELRNQALNIINEIDNCIQISAENKLHI